MLRYLTQRAIAFLPTLIGVSILIFTAIRLVPGDAITAMLGTEAGMLTDTQRASLEAYFGLDQPPVQQYFNWLGGVVQGNLGLSMRYGQPVLDLIFLRFPVTLQLAIMALIVALLIGIPLGVLSAISRNSFIDLFARLFALLGLAMPNFLLGTLIIFVLSVYFRYLPNSGNYTPLNVNPAQNFQQMIFPAITLGFAFSASVMRTTRSAMLEVLGQDYMRTAQGKGLRERRILLVHALRNSLIPMVTLLGISVPTVVTGAFITETIFSWPGIGRLGVEAVTGRDYPVIMAVTMMSALLIVVGNLLADVAYAWVDPRIRYE